MIQRNVMEGRRVGETVSLKNKKCLMYYNRGTERGGGEEEEKFKKIRGGVYISPIVLEEHFLEFSLEFLVCKYECADFKTNSLVSSCRKRKRE